MPVHSQMCYFLTILINAVLNYIKFLFIFRKRSQPHLVRLIPYIVYELVKFLFQIVYLTVCFRRMWLEIVFSWRQRNTKLYNGTVLANHNGIIYTKLSHKTAQIVNRFSRTHSNLYTGFLYFLKKLHVLR